MQDELKDLYQKIFECHICPLMDSQKALRKVELTNTSADVFIISQSLARDTLRESGISFITKELKIGSTGRQLEKFLNKFGRTIDPKNEKCVYNSEIAQCYPGKNKNGKGDRKPTQDEMANCLHFLLKEIDLVKPKVILLMGKSSRDAFWKYVLKKKCLPFSEHVGKLDYYNGIPIIPIQHASGANPRYKKMLANEKLVSLIKDILNE
jgi:uracil-DNA glycosylase family 4